LSAHFRLAITGSLEIVISCFESSDTDIDNTIRWSGELLFLSDVRGVASRVVQFLGWTIVPSQVEIDIILTRSLGHDLLTSSHFHGPDDHHTFLEIAIRVHWRALEQFNVLTARGRRWKFNLIWAHSGQGRQREVLIGSVLPRSVIVLFLLLEAPSRGAVAAALASHELQSMVTFLDLSIEVKLGGTATAPHV